MKKTLRSLRPTEALVFALILCLCMASLIYILHKIDQANSIYVPVRGGSYSEGIVGEARFINPVLSYSDADKDMSALIFNGLLKATPQGTLAPDLAQSWTVSSDGLTYDVILKPNLKFQDGTPLTTDDVEFTVNKVLDPAIQSPLAASWADVTVQKISPTEIQFVLKTPDVPFLENLTLGILPKHIWQNVDDSNFSIFIQNREPIGSGPYRIKKAYKNASGAYQYYDLAPFAGYAGGEAYISDFIVRFYSNEDDALSAYRSGSIQGLGDISPEDATDLRDKGYDVESAPLPRIFGLFLNQNSAPIFVNKEVRQALSMSVDNNALIQQVLQGWGVPATGPIPAELDPTLVPGLDGNATGTTATALSATSSDTSSSSADSATNPAGPATLSTSSSSTPPTLSTTSAGTDPVAAARQLLIDKGWKLGDDGVFEEQSTTGGKTVTNRLSFTISTSNDPELKDTAEALKEIWKRLGADVQVQIYQPSDLASKVIQPRQYDALLFGEEVGRDLDLFPFWHSSERNDPGLNVALYTNVKADAALETLRTSTDPSTRYAAIETFKEQVANDIPAIFLYSPDYIYATNRKVSDMNIVDMTTAAERFMDVSQWYVETEKLWKIFAR